MLFTVITQPDVHPIWSLMYTSENIFIIVSISTRCFISYTMYVPLNCNGNIDTSFVLWMWLEYFIILKQYIDIFFFLFFCLIDVKGRKVTRARHAKRVHWSKLRRGLREPPRVMYLLRKSVAFVWGSVYSFVCKFDAHIYNKILCTCVAPHTHTHIYIYIYIYYHHLMDF